MRLAGGRGARERLVVIVSAHVYAELGRPRAAYDVADLVLTMTRGHRDAILAQWPEAAGRRCGWSRRPRNPAS